MRLTITLFLSAIFLSGCAGDSRAAKDNPRRIDLGGVGVVDCRLMNTDLGDKSVLVLKMEKVQAINFYESYVVIEGTENQRNYGRVVPLSQVQTFEWRK
jgi:nitrous oxide reductase accessory protein NosL